MEKAGILIKRLQEQYDNRAAASSLLVTTQLLMRELQAIDQARVQHGAKVSVILPAVPAIVPADIADSPAVAAAPAAAPLPVTTEPVPSEPPAPVVSIKKPTPEHIYSFLEEIPTFAYQQKTGNELNDVMATSQESLNERLKTERTELAHKLKDTPVKDLRKAIGINDRFVFINELFRGDEDMYERSIKTINSFSILPEAEYWIQRELKLKLGWNENLESVQHFDQLVRRRFS